MPNSWQPVTTNQDKIELGNGCSLCSSHSTLSKIADHQEDQKEFHIAPTDGVQIVETLEPSGAKFYDLVLKKPLRDMEKVLKAYELYDRWSLVL